MRSCPSKFISYSNSWKNKKHKQRFYPISFSKKKKRLFFLLLRIRSNCTCHCSPRLIVFSLLFNFCLFWSEHFVVWDFFIYRHRFGMKMMIPHFFLYLSSCKKWTNQSTYEFTSTLTNRYIRTLSLSVLYFCLSFFLFGYLHLRMNYKFCTGTITSLSLFSTQNLSKKHLELCALTLFWQASLLFLRITKGELHEHFWTQARFSLWCAAAAAAGATTNSSCTKHLKKK